MNPWLFIALITSGIVFLIDYLLRRKKWNDNTKNEKISLIVNMLSVSLHLFLSAVGILLGIAGGWPKTALGHVLYNATLTMAGYYFIIALIDTVGSLILRKFRKIKASIWINIIAFAYIILVLCINCLAGELL
jgi:O-antigen/teichoic acid export membrane protein